MSITSPRHIISSEFFSLDDDPASQAFADHSVVIDALKFAAENRIEPDFEYANIFPGEHYRLLSGLVKTIEAKILVDIGTYRGCSARVMLDNSPKNSLVVSFDICPYDSFDWTVLKSEDFSKGNLICYVEDLAEPNIFEKNTGLLNDAEFIMLDGPKNDVFEETFLTFLSKTTLKHKKRWLFIDDIRFKNMQYLWRRIQSPKIDLSSFGHFSGSGLVNISEGLTLY